MTPWIICFLATLLVITLIALWSDRQHRKRLEQHERDMHDIYYK